MNIPSEISAYITQRAESKAKAHAIAATRLLTEELQKSASNEITVASPTGGTLAINPSFVESLQQGLVSSSLDRFQKEELDEFIKGGLELLAAKKKKD